MEAATAGMICLSGAIGTVMLSLAVPPRYARRLLTVSVVLTWLAVAVLVVALLGNDFTLEYVVRTTSRATPWPYRLAALWGGMEGSMLFYSALTLGIGAYAVRRRGRTESVVVGVVGTGLLLLTALGSNPFRRLDIPAVDGEGLLAILQHPAMIYHPPILYLGLTMLIVPFAIAVGRLLPSGTIITSESILATRRWLTRAWMWLALGMLAGANWAYVELGWGGYWAWDPVENTALMPWLGATVFLHLSRVYERDGRLNRLTLFSAMFPFALSVLGVYLTRSGVTGSIHAFAEDPVIGKILLTASGMVTVLIVAVVVRSTRGREWGQPGLGRDTWLATSGGLITAILVFVLVGSAYPAFLAVFRDRTVVVDSRFFVTTVLPVALIMVTLIGFAMHTTWTTSRIARRDTVGFLGVAVIAAALAMGLAIETVTVGVILLAVAAGAVAIITRDLITRRHGRRYLPTLLAHLGISVILVASGASALGTEFSGRMNIGDTAEVGPYVIELAEVNVGERGRILFAEGLFKVNGTTVMRPEVRAYERQGLPVAEPALRSTPISDLIIAVTRLTPEADGFEVSVYVRPMVWWVWVGALVLSAAGFLALRDAAVSGRRRQAIEAQPATGTTT